VKSKQTIFISTWNHGKIANAKAIEVVNNGGSTIDAVEQGVMLVESDPKVSSVGLGGWPDREGHVTLDASIMDYEGNAGSVCFLEGFEHPISVARKVMEETPHVLLAGDGAAQFARDQGFEEIDLLTKDSIKAWEDWKIKSKYKPVINIENHDTIGMVGLHQGELGGCCTTSGLAFKMRGRVGDSPIIGAGLYVDGEVGACSATGLGEYILKSQSSFLVVELMRQGKNPEEACKEALQRIVKKYWKNKKHSFQVGLVALNLAGEYAGYSIVPGYTYAINIDGESQIVEAPYLLEK
jgi:isoaspartyl peptidase/L-asparaginase-like protein (Ntn-hydrolase superfamily)